MYACMYPCMDVGMYVWVYVFTPVCACMNMSARRAVPLNHAGNKTGELRLCSIEILLTFLPAGEIYSVVSETGSYKPYMT